MVQIEAAGGAAFRRWKNYNIPAARTVVKLVASELQHDTSSATHINDHVFPLFLQEDKLSYPSHTMCAHAGVFLTSNVYWIF